MNGCTQHCQTGQALRRHSGYWRIIWQTRFQRTGHCRTAGCCPLRTRPARKQWPPTYHCPRGPNQHMGFAGAFAQSCAGSTGFSGLLCCKGLAVSKPPCSLQIARPRCWPAWATPPVEGTAPTHYPVMLRREHGAAHGLACCRWHWQNCRAARYARLDNHARQPESGQ